MNVVFKLFNNIKKFGFFDTFCYVLLKSDVLRQFPAKYLIKRADYYKNLPLAEQKKELGLFYKNAIGKEMDIENPKTFTEKIQWMKFNDSTKRKADYSDKFLAPKLIEKEYGSRINIIPQLGVWDKAEDIDFDVLPQKFVLKCNHGSAMNIIVKDKSKLDIAETRRKLNDWLKIDYAYVNGMYENHYTFIDRKIIAEKFIEEMDGNLHDYKFHCFMGEPRFIEFIGDRVVNTHVVHDSIYTIDWQLTDIHMNEDIPYEKGFEKPEKLDEMITLAREMSKPYSYVRVDFYYINGKIFFGELTFTPDSGCIKFNHPKTDAEWGEWIKLSAAAT